MRVLVLTAGHCCLDAAEIVITLGLYDVNVVDSKNDWHRIHVISTRDIRGSMPIAYLENLSPGIDLDLHSLDLCILPLDVNRLIDREHRIQPLSIGMPPAAEPE